MKLTYSYETIVENEELPDNFTGKVEYENGSVVYQLNGKLHRDGGLPAVISKYVQSYYVNDKITVRFWY